MDRALLICGLWVLNLWDAICTSIVFGSVGIQETNPVMRVLLEQGVGYFLFVKVAAISLCSALLWKLWYRHKRTPLVAKSLVLIYWLVALWHVVLISIMFT